MLLWNKSSSLYVYICSLEGEVSGLFLQSSACAGAPGVRDSGYDSLRRRMSILDRLMQTHSVWLLLSLSDEEARRILQSQPAGVKTTASLLHNNRFFCYLFFITVSRIHVCVCVLSRLLWWEGVINCRKRWFPYVWTVTHRLFWTSQLKRVNIVSDILSLLSLVDH